MNIAKLKETIIMVGQRVRARSPEVQLGYRPIHIARIGNYAALIFPVRNHTTKAYSKISKKYKTILFGDEIFDRCLSGELKSYYPLSEEEKADPNKGYKNCGIIVSIYHIRSSKVNKDVANSILQRYSTIYGNGIHNFLELDYQ